MVISVDGCETGFLAAQMVPCAVSAGGLATATGRGPAAVGGTTAGTARRAATACPEVGV